jgi:hypothetical protein
MARISSRFFSFVSGSLFLFGSLFIGTAPASAVTFGFDCISNNLAGDCTIGEAQLSVDVTDPGSGRIDFTFRNVGAGASSIGDVYWDDSGVLDAIFAISGSPNVDFSEGASPGNLPAGNNASPPFSADFAADSNPPTQPNGVGPGEFLTVTFELGGVTFADAIQALNNGSMRVGIHVQGFASGGSESFVIPEPGTFALVGSGLLALAIRRRRS